MIIELIIAAIIGVLFGNYASTALFRLPRGIPIHGYNRKVGKPPHCSTCGHELKFYEYLPILGWFSTRGKCNYCGAKTNPQYTMLEIGSALLALVIYFITGGCFSENYVLLLLAGTSFLLSIFIFENQDSVVNKVLFVLAIIGIVYRTLNEASIVGLVISLAFAYAIYIMFTYDREDTEIKENFSLKLILLAGVWLKIKYQLFYLVCIYVVNQIESPSKNRFRILSALLYSLITIIHLVNN